MLETQILLQNIDVTSDYWSTKKMILVVGPNENQ